MRTSSRRLDRVPKYLFSGLEAIREEADRAGLELLDLGIGDPDLPTPRPVVEALAQAARDPANHRYPAGRGLERFRIRISEWFRGRFGVELDPHHEVLVLIGTKEGLAHLPLAVCDPGDAVLVPDPAYPVYRSAALLAGAEPVAVPLEESKNFLMDVAGALSKAPGVRLCYLNYPNNPTGAAADLDYYRSVVGAAREAGTVVCCDAAYSEITYGGKRAPSILQVEGAKEVAVEMHSFSKTFNMTGWRVGFAVGNAEVLEALADVKSNVDSGVFQAVQEAAMAALDLGVEDAERRLGVYRERMELVVSALEGMGCEVWPPRGGLYVWARTPEGRDSAEFCAEVLRKAGVSLAPGAGFGDAGEGYFRISLTVPVEVLDRAMGRLAGLGLWEKRDGEGSN